MPCHVGAGRHRRLALPGATKSWVAGPRPSPIGTNNFRHSLVLPIFPERSTQMPSEDNPAREQIDEGRLRQDGQAQHLDQLAQQSPETWPDQAAPAERGESSSASTNDSSKSSITKWARMYGLAERSTVLGGHTARSSSSAAGAEFHPPAQTVQVQTHRRWRIPRPSARLLK
jgi:hypothetical protein